MKRVLALVSALVVLGLTGFAGSAGAAPGTGLGGACNMLADATMFTIPMAHDAAQGNAGMYHAVAVSGGC